MSNSKMIQQKCLLLALQKTPIVEQACRTADIPRANYYRWLKEDSVFREKVDEALEQSIGIVDDLAQSMLIELIKSGNYQAIIFWLTHRNKAYMPKSKEELSAKKMENMPLSKEAQAVLDRALNGVQRGRKEPPPNEPIALDNSMSSGRYLPAGAIEGEIIPATGQPNGLLPLEELQRMIDEYKRLSGRNPLGSTYI